MNKPWSLALVGFLLWSGSSAASQICSPTLDFEKRRLAETDTERLCEEYQGRVLLLVNTASKCAFTDQYEELEALYRRYKDKGFVVLGFPSNDFGNQEPGSEQQIKNFCRLTYSVEFPMFEKTRVREGVADPLFRRLAELSGSYPKWNFHKYLIDREGNLVQHYSSSTSPGAERLSAAIEALL